MIIMRFLLGFLLLSLSLILSIKPMSKIFIESYISDNLQEKVILTKYELFPINAEMYIAHKKNRLTLAVTTLSPLRANFRYKGNIDAFKEYQPLSAESELDGVILYDDVLELKAELLIPTLSIEKEMIKDVRVDIALLGDKLEVISSLEHQKFKVENLTLNYNLENGEFNVQTNLDVLGIDKIKLKTEGEVVDGNITAVVDAVFSKNSEFNFQADVKKDANTTRVEIFSKELVMFEQKFKDVKIKTNYKNRRFIIDGSLRNSKELEYLNFRIEGRHEESDIFAKAEFDAKELKLLVKELTYTKKTLKLEYDLLISLLKTPLHFRGNLDYKDKLDLTANTKDFGGDLKFHLVDKKLQLSASKLSLKKVLAMAKQKPYVNGSFDLNAEGDFEKINFKVKTHKLVTSKREMGVKQKVTLNAKGSFLLTKKLLKLGYVMKVPLKTENIRVGGKLKYDKSLTLSGNTMAFGSSSYFKMKGEHILLNAKQIDLKKLLRELEQPIYARGKVDLHLNGKINNLDIKLKSKKLRTDKKLIGIEEDVTFQVDANYTPLRVKFQPYLKASMIELGKGNSIYSFKKKELVVKQNFKLIHKKIRAPLYVEATLNEDDISVTTASLGGDTKIYFKDKKLDIELTKLSLVKIDKLFLKENIFQRGELSGEVSYDLELKKASTNLKVDNALVNGVDLDSELGTLVDAVSLNILRLKNELFDDNKTQETEITHLQLDLELKDEVVHLKDSAFSTPRFRIAMDGDINQSGSIKSLDIYLLDKNGCSIVTQKISGSLKKPKLENKILTTKDVIVSIPGSIIKKPEKLLNFTSKAVDKTASFLLHLTQLSDSNVTLISDINNRTFNLVEDTSKIVLIECKSVYDGKVKAP